VASPEAAAVRTPFLRRPRLRLPRVRQPTEYRFPSTCQIPGLADRYRELFGDLKTDGTFVEVGAYDGDSFSNTSGLADLGWAGLYVEPVPRYARACARRHAGNKRVLVANCAIGTVIAMIDFFLGEGLSTARQDQVEVYEQIAWTKGFHTGEHIQVPQFPLHHLLAEAAIKPGFELLVVDVEGSEDAVFDSFSLDTWKPQVVIVELIDHHPDFQSFERVIQRSSHLRARIKHHGYREHYVDHINTIFRRAGS
jgi:FkbM family methyltransferase